MIKKYCKTIAVVAVIAALTSGCRSSDEYRKLTEAGNKYAQAVNSLLITAADIHLESSSEQILKDDRLTNQTIQEYQKYSQLDEERLHIINDLRLHNQLLQAYFSKLEDLANSDAPHQSATEIEGIVSNLNSVGQKLHQSDLITHKGVFPRITRLVVDSQIRGALKQELEKRHQIILRELTLQQEMLNALGDSMQHEIELIKQAREERLVIRPLIQDELIQNEDGWIQTRKNILTMDRKVTELKNASQTLGEFKEVFQASVEGKISIQRLNTALKEIDSFIALVEIN